MTLIAHKPAVLLAALVVAAVPLFAQNRVTVAQMEQQIDALAQQKNGPASEQLSSFQLTERVSGARLARWQSLCKRQLVWQTLLYLADASSVYDLPASEASTAPPPDEPTRAAILGKARQYMHTMRSHLPNFLAKREATTFQNATLSQMQGEESQLQFLEMSSDKLGFRSLGAVTAPRQLFLEGSAEAVVTYRDGSEVQTPAPKAHGKHRSLVTRSLSSYGEFGSILTLVDPAVDNGSIAWHHWEEGPSGLLAVFRFNVPAEKSRFAVSSSLAGIPGVPSTEYPSYHGDVSIDPATGSVFRFAVIAEPSPSDAAAGSGSPGAMVVEYGAVDIGGKSYVCPLHAVSIYQATDSDLRKSSDVPRTVLNDVTFSDYHLFRSEMRMLP